MGMNEPRALHVTEGEGKKLWVADELMAFKASGKDTGGAYALTDSVEPSGGRPAAPRPPSGGRGLLGARGGP